MCPDANPRTSTASSTLNLVLMPGTVFRMQSHAPTAWLLQQWNTMKLVIPELYTMELKLLGTKWRYTDSRLSTLSEGIEILHLNILFHKKRQTKQDIRCYLAHDLTIMTCLSSVMKVYGFEIVLLAPIDCRLQVLQVGSRSNKSPNFRLCLPRRWLWSLDCTRPQKY